MNKKLIGKEIATLNGEYRYWPNEKPGKPLQKTHKEREIDFGKAGYHDVKAVRLVNKAQCRRVAPKYIKDFNYPWLRYLDLFPGDYWENKTVNGLRSPNKRAPPKLDWTTSLAKAQYGEAIRLRLLKQEEELKRKQTVVTPRRDVQFIPVNQPSFHVHQPYQEPSTLRRPDPEIKIIHNNNPLPPERPDPVRSVVTVDPQNFQPQGDRSNTIKVVARPQPDQIRIITNQTQPPPPHFANANTYSLSRNVSTIPVDPIYAQVDRSRHVIVEPPPPPPPAPPIQRDTTNRMMRPFSEEMENPLYDTAEEIIEPPPPPPPPEPEPEPEDYFNVIVHGGTFLDEVIVPEEADIYYGRERSNSLPGGGSTPWMTGKTFEETEDLQNATIEKKRGSVKFQT